jgi:hypothetical protein
MIAIVAVRPNVILGRRHLFSPQREPSVFFFWQNMAYCRKKCPFSTAFKLRFKEIFAKGKIGRAISYRDNRRSARSGDRRLVKQENCKKRGQALRELPLIVEQNRRWNDGLIETRSTSIVINKV